MNIEFAGLKTTGKVETVWCVIKLSDHPEYRWYSNYLIVWGRRGGKLQFRTRIGYRKPEKLYNGSYSRFSALGQEINKKRNQEYVDVSDQLDSVYPEFETDLNKLAIWETMKL